MSSCTAASPATFCALVELDVVGDALGIDSVGLLISEEDHVHVLEAEVVGVAALDQDDAEEGMLSEDSVNGLTLAMSD